ncbi:MAG: hypothetical protein Q7K98_06725 [Candidatus Omnitrophota bacterium]|nr:hypothetical protein [Candidatus Omnitrophota bacterium]
MRKKSLKIIAIFLCILLAIQQSGFAQVAVELNIAARLTALHNSFGVDKFRPLHLRYLQYLPENNSFKLYLDKGDQFPKSEQKKGTVPVFWGLSPFSTESLEVSTKTLLNYFFIGLTLPNDSFWVNLRPDAQDNIIDDYLAKTDVGKIMLEADLQLKKDTALATSPETPEGRDYWNKLYAKAGELFGSENITIPTLTRPWIVPDEIIIRETKDAPSAYIYKATLKVMLESDYLSSVSRGHFPSGLSENAQKESVPYAQYQFKDERLKQLNEYSSQLIRELIIPKLTKDINISKRYAPLRQVYYSLILAQWFKARHTLKVGDIFRQGDNGTLKRKVSPDARINSRNLTNLISQQPWSKTTYFQAYQKSFKDGEYNIKEPVYTPTGQVIRSYFSGGENFAINIQPFGTVNAGSSPVSTIVATSSPAVRSGELVMDIQGTPGAVAGIQVTIPSTSSRLVVSEPAEGGRVESAGSPMTKEAVFKFAKNTRIFLKRTMPQAVCAVHAAWLTLVLRSQGNEAYVMEKKDEKGGGAHYYVFLEDEGFYVDPYPEGAGLEHLAASFGDTGVVVLSVNAPESDFYRGGVRLEEAEYNNIVFYAEKAIQDFQLRDYGLSSSPAASPAQKETVSSLAMEEAGNTVVLTGLKEHPGEYYNKEASDNLRIFLKALGVPEGSVILNIGYGANPLSVRNEQGVPIYRVVNVDTRIPYGIKEGYFEIWEKDFFEFNPNSLRALGLQKKPDVILFYNMRTYMNIYGPYKMYDPSLREDPLLNVVEYFRKSEELVAPGGHILFVNFMPPEGWASPRFIPDIVERLKDRKTTIFKTRNSDYSKVAVAFSPEVSSLVTATKSSASPAQKETASSAINIIPSIKRWWGKFVSNKPTQNKELIKVGDIPDTERLGGNLSGKDHTIEIIARNTPGLIQPSTVIAFANVPDVIVAITEAIKGNVQKMAVLYLTNLFLKHNLESLHSPLLKLRNNGIIFEPAFSRMMSLYARQRGFAGENIGGIYFTSYGLYTNGLQAKFKNDQLAMELDIPSEVKFEYEQKEGSIDALSFWREGKLIGQKTKEPIIFYTPTLDFIEAKAEKAGVRLLGISPSFDKVFYITTYGEVISMSISGRRYMNNLQETTQNSKAWLNARYPNVNMDSLNAFLSALKPSVSRVTSTSGEELKYILTAKDIAGAGPYFELEKPVVSIRDSRRLVKRGLVYYQGLLFKPTPEGKEALKKAFALKKINDETLDFILTHLMYTALNANAEKAILLELEDIFLYGISGHYSTLKHVFTTGNRAKIYSLQKELVLQEAETIKNGSAQKASIFSTITVGYKGKALDLRANGPFDLLLMLLTEETLDHNETMVDITSILENKLTMVVNKQTLSLEDILTNQINFKDGDIVYFKEPAASPAQKQPVSSAVEVKIEVPQNTSSPINEKISKKQRREIAKQYLIKLGVKFDRLTPERQPQLAKLELGMNLFESEPHKQLINRLVKKIQRLSQLLKVEIGIHIAPSADLPIMLEDEFYGNCIIVSPSMLRNRGVAKNVKQAKAVLEEFGSVFLGDIGLKRGKPSVPVALFISAYQEKVEDEEFISNQFPYRDFFVLYSDERTFEQRLLGLVQWDFDEIDGKPPYWFRYVLVERYLDKLLEIAEHQNNRKQNAQSLSSPIVTDTHKQANSVVNNGVDDGKGGIDFRALPIVTQAMSNLRLSASSVISLSQLKSLNLNQELQEMQKLVDAGITPSAERIKEYVASSCLQGNPDTQKVVSCIADILRLEEERCYPTEVTLKDILVVLESGMPNQELKAVFTGLR